MPIRGQHEDPHDQLFPARRYDGDGYCYLCHFRRDARIRSAVRRLVERDNHDAERIVRSDLPLRRYDLERHRLGWRRGQRLRACLQQRRRQGHGLVAGGLSQRIGSAVPQQRRRKLERPRLRRTLLRKLERESGRLRPGDFATNRSIVQLPAPSTGHKQRFFAVLMACDKLEAPQKSLNAVEIPRGPKGLRDHALA
jgi:hypothetical protein